MLDYARGNTEAFELLYSRYKQPLFQFMLNSCNNEALAGELFQDVWTKVINARESYSSAAPFRAWLFRIARNHLTDHYRSRANEQHDVALEKEHMSGGSIWGQKTLTPDQVTQITQQSNVLQGALATLPEEQREAIVLKHVAGMSIDEIAQIQEEGPQTIKSRLRYAIRKLRAQLLEPS